ncbi:Gfo/Idh/MocA family oxidoreductase [Mesorhizobium sp. M0898]|uniref:Gfo/Idh/MocA family protein n=1 Tax=Mesorhizobium sp. M0898 TaxID=2957020 RepID=UPI00333539A0
MLDDKEVDAVLIASPHHLHAEMAIGAAKAGKHILLEKPMAPTVAACDAINAAVAKGGVKLMVAHLMHFAPPCMAARQILEEGELGRPLAGSSWIIKLWMEHNRRDWHLRKATGGGMLLTAGIHAVDRLVWLMDDDVVSVSGMLGAKFHDQEADDSALLGLRFAGGGIGQVQSVGYRTGATTYAMDLVCERGTLRIDMDRGTMLGRETVWTELPGSFEPNWMHNALVREWSAMRDAIADDTPSAGRRHLCAQDHRHYRGCLRVERNPPRTRDRRWTLTSTTIWPACPHTHRAASGAR